MKHPDSEITVFGFMLLSAMLFGPVLCASPLTDAEARGKALYLTGDSPSGKPVKAQVGAESIELTATHVPCVSCHGEDGHGRPEGGIVPSNITFEYLTLTYGHNHDNGRKHAAFTTETIISAVTNGRDPSDNRLDFAMPRYTLSDSDSADLIAYLQRLSTDVDTGLTDTTIRLGTLLPMRGPLADMGLAMKALLLAYFNEINAQGGIYNRKIHLEVAEFTGSADSTIKNVRDLFENDPVFAMIAPFSGNLEQDILLLSERQGIPQIGPYTLFPEDDPVRSRSVFYVLPGLNNESRAMVDYAVDVLHLKNSSSMIIRPENRHFQRVATVIEKQSHSRGLGSVAQFAYSEPSFQSSVLADQLNKQAPEVIFFWGTQDELGILLKSAKALKTRPYVFISGSLTGSSVFDKGFDDNIFLSFPALPHDPTNADKFFRLLKRNNLTTQHLTAQAVTYSAAKLLAEGLQRTGKELSRKKLLKTIENIYQFDTGLIPSLSYGPNRHIGSTEVYIVSAPRK